MDDLEFRPYLRDGIDVYIHRDGTITFVFLSTRKRIQLNTRPYLAEILGFLDGTHTVSELMERTIKHHTPLGTSQVSTVQNQVHSFINYLIENNIVVEVHWYDHMPFEDSYKERIKKQIFFLMDILPNADAVFDVQKKILETRVAIVGLGAVGSWILVELLGMGFQNFKLFDFDLVEQSDSTRHAYFSSSNTGIRKIDAYRDLARAIAPDVSIQGLNESISVDFDPRTYFHDVDLIINCADEPYIGYTSIYLSRYCVQHNKLLFVAGGFDAHLGCLGELIVPYQTPCSDCYNKFFKDSLLDWNPIKHPIKDRTRGFGGLNSLAIFSASSAALQILSYFAAPDQFLETANRRGEFLFDDYAIETFSVNKDPDCAVCGG